MPENDSSIRLIPLTQGQFAIVDAADFEYLNKWKWCAHKRPNMFYVVRNEIDRTIYMHRQIMSDPKELQVDHINGNGLDNRRENLRLASSIQNSFNRGKTSQNTSGFKGVTWNKERKKWLARIYAGENFIFLGWHLSKEAAAKAYDNAALKYHGEFSRVNFQ